MEYISDAQAKQMILEVGRRMYQGGFVAANDGNISCKVGDNGIWATPTGVSKGFMTEDMLVKLDLDGNVLEGTHKPSSEIKMHLRVFKENPKVQGVVHAHPLTATAFACAGISLEGADGRSSVLRLCAVSAFCSAGHRGSAGSGSSLLSGIQCSTVSKPRCADLGRQSHAGILPHGDHGILCEDPDDEQLHPREKDVVVPGTDRRYYQDPCRMGHHHGRQTHRTGGRAESGGYLCFKETVMA